MTTTENKIATGDAFAMDLQRVVEQTMAIQRCMKAVMQTDVHYGVVPGTNGKPSLYQAGSDKLCLLFRLRPEYEESAVIEAATHISIKIRCRLYHIPTGTIWGEGMGSANSRESKYLNQATAKVCPHCKKAAIIKGAEKFGGGWLCYAKKDGCGAKFADDDAAIVGQVGQINSDKVWDLHNTILKIACKRAKVAAVLTATAASDFFTQDLEDLEGEAGENNAPPAANKGAAVGSATAQGARATVVQIRDLNLALRELKVSAEQSVAWANGILGLSGKDMVNTLGQLTPDEAARLIAAAKAGEMPEVRE